MKEKNPSKISCYCTLTLLETRRRSGTCTNGDAIPEEAVKVNGHPPDDDDQSGREKATVEAKAEVKIEIKGEVKIEVNGEVKGESAFEGCAKCKNVMFCKECLPRHR